MSLLEPSPVTKLVFLGTGTPNPDPNRLGPSAAIVVNGQPYLVDFGAGLVRQAVAAGKQGVEGLTSKHLTRAFLTHLHSDHTIGLPDLILTGAVAGREEPLRIYGPVGSQHMVDHILQAWSQDIETRLHGGEPSIPAAYEVIVEEFWEGRIYEDENVSVSAFAVSHGTWRPAFGLRFETADRVVVFSGDTTYCPNLIEHARGCDILVHEVYSEAGLAERTPEWQAYHSSFHTSTIDVARIANAVQPKLVLLYRALPFRQSEESMLEEVKAQYAGDVILVNDLDVF